MKKTTVLFFLSNLIKTIINIDIIPISMATDDNYIFPTIVSITSIILNKKNTTKYDFYIMIPPYLKKENIQKLKSLEKKHKKNCTINIINMGEKYKNAPTNTHITTPGYYRLSLSILLPNINKIIYLDGDTITHNDLKEMYDLDMTNLYYRGYLDINPNEVNHITRENDHVICTGVLLINLDELRKDNMVNVFDKFINEHSNLLYKHDQTIINGLCYKKIGFLPPKFAMWNWGTFKDVKYFFDLSKYKYKCSYQELEDAFYHPVITHCTDKPWKNYAFNYSDVWWNYAWETDFYWEIYRKYSKLYKKRYRIFFISLSIIFLIVIVVKVVKKKLNENKKIEYKKE